MIVFNNSALAFVELEMKAASMLDCNGPSQPGFHEDGGGCERVRTKGKCAGASPPPPGPRAKPSRAGIVEVVVDRQELALPPSIKLDQVKGFSLFMMKAVIDGRGSEVIDLLKTNLF
jgi:pyruvate dehydrogenase (quinone)